MNQLRGERTEAAFGKLLGVSAATVKRLEMRRAIPEPAISRRLSKLAKKERFLEDWKLKGSITYIGEGDPDDYLEAHRREMQKLWQDSIERTAREL